MTIGSFTTWIKVPLMLAPALPQRLEKNALSPLMITFQRDGSFLGCKTGKKIFNRIKSQGGRERTYNYKFS